MAKQTKIIQSIDLDMTGLAEYFKGYSFNNEIMMIRVTDLNKELIDKAASGLISNSYRLDALTVLLPWTAIWMFLWISTATPSLRSPFF